MDSYILATGQVGLPHSFKSNLTPLLVGLFGYGSRGRYQFAAADDDGKPIVVAGGC